MKILTLSGNTCVDKKMNTINYINGRGKHVVAEAIINNKVPNGVYNISDNINYTYDDLLRWQKANLILII